MTLKQLPRAMLVALVVTICIGCDQGTKFVAKEYLKPDAAISFAGDLFRLQYAENTGAFLSLGSSLPEDWRQWIFTVFVGLFLVGLLLYVVFSRDLDFNQVACLSLVCGGGLSNLIDRIVYDGRVVDFLNVGVGSIRTGIFNVADMAITAGAILLAIDGFRKTPEKS
jgi:signal peptidase II